MENSVIKKTPFIKRQLKKFSKKSKSEKITYISFFIFYFVMAVLILYPIFVTIMNSFRSQFEYIDFTRSPFKLPETWIFDGWGQIFSNFIIDEVSYTGMLINSLWMLVVRVTLNILSSTVLAYAVARFRFPGRNFLYGVVIFSQTIPLIGAGAAGYKLFVALNMINNPFNFWIAWCVGFDFAFIVLYGTFKGISGTYSEAAKIDGANNLTVLFRIIFPQAFPSIAALAITQAIGVWNDYNTSLIYLRKYPTIAYGLFVFQTDSQHVSVLNSNALYCAAITLSMLPVLILYAASQKLILTNMTTGGLKG